MEINNFFSRENLDGVDPQYFHNELKFNNMKNLFVSIIDEEIKFLEDCISDAHRLSTESDDKAEQLSYKIAVQAAALTDVKKIISKITL